MANFFSKRREPFQFMLILGMVGSGLLFFFILFVFILKEIKNQQVSVPLPVAFWFSTFFIVFSSFTLNEATKAFKNDNFSRYRLGVSATYVASLLFLGTQLWGWNALFLRGITLANHTGGSFVYILSGLHILHTLGGVIALSFALRDALRHRTYIDSFVYSVNPPNQLRLKLIAIYWHFIDVLWLVLFLFLLYHASQN